MGDGANAPKVEVVVEAASARLDENDPRWLDQVADLPATMRAAGGAMQLTLVRA